MRIKFDSDEPWFYSFFSDKRIPCTIKMGVDRSFSIHFGDPQPILVGDISEPDIDKFHHRVMGTKLGGGYLHHCNALVTLERVDGAVYEVLRLEFFQRHIGWFSVIESGCYLSDPIISDFDSDDL